MRQRAEKLEKLSADLEAKSTDQLVVVTLKSLQGTSIEDYGYQLGRKWQIGQKDKNNGVLLIVAPNERKVRIEVGYGLEGTLTDALGSSIIQQAILPRFRAGDFAGGITRGAEDIVQVLTGDAEEYKQRAPSNAPDNQPDLADVLIFLFFMVVFFMIVGSVTRRGREHANAGPGARRGSRGPIIVPFPGSWGSSSDSSWSDSSGGFSGGGGSFGGGGASGSW